MLISPRTLWLGRTFGSCQSHACSFTCLTMEQARVDGRAERSTPQRACRCQQGPRQMHRPCPHHQHPRVCLLPLPSVRQQIPQLQRQQRFLRLLRLHFQHNYQHRHLQLWKMLRFFLVQTFWHGESHCLFRCACTPIYPKSVPSFGWFSKQKTQLGQTYSASQATSTFN